MSMEDDTYSLGEEVKLSGGGEDVSWRLLATLEVATVLLVTLALCVHALRTRAARARTLVARTVLISKGETELGQKLAQAFLREGCVVTLLTAVPEDTEHDKIRKPTPVPKVKKSVLTNKRKELTELSTILPDIDIIKENITKLRHEKSMLTDTVQKSVTLELHNQTTNQPANLSEATSLVSNGSTTHTSLTRMHCDITSRDEVSVAAEKVGDFDVLVVCGADSDGDRLEALAKNVSEDIYSNFNVLQEMGRRLQKSGTAVWVCQEPTGHYSGAVRALHSLASTMLHQIAHSRGSRAVWCSGRDETLEQLAARVVRTVARDGALPTSADVFREVRYRIRTGLHEIFYRFCKLWTWF